MQTDRLPVVDCPHELRERGRAHGEALRQVIADKIERWHAAIGEAYGEAAARFLPRFLAANDFRTAILAHAPDLMEEVAGIAEGAGITAETAYLLQLMDEEWWFGQSTADGHCSSLAIASGDKSPTILGQTMDLPRWHEGAQALLRVSNADGHETLIFTSAGMIGLMGVSGRGLGVCVNTLSQLAVSPNGLPVAFAMRGALACASADAAACFLGKVQHASGQNYQLGDRSGARTLECSAGGAVDVPFEAGRSLHTNDPMASRDARSPDVVLSGSVESRGRLASLTEDLSARSKPMVNVETVKSALSACRPQGAVSIAVAETASAIESITFGAVVYEIGETVTLFMSGGAPHTQPWRSFTLK